MFITAYTPDRQRDVLELLATCDQFDLDAQAVGVPDLGDWCDAGSHIARVVRDAMLRHESREIVWLAPGSRVRQAPSLFDELRCDAAFYLKTGESNAQTDTLFFAGTPAAWRLVELWLGYCRAEPTLSAGQNLHAAINATLISSARQANYSNLPIEYAATRKTCPRDRIVIEHPA